MPLVLCTREEAENYLMHYRTKGSKNGVRKYQNEDGSYTALGRIHYGIGKAREKAHLAIAKSNSNKAAKLEGKAAKLANKAEIARIKYELHPDSAAAKAKYSDAANKSNRANVNLGLAKNRAQLHEQAAKNIANRDDMTKEDKFNAKADKLQLKSERNALLEKKYGAGEFAARAKKQALKSELARARAKDASLDPKAKAEKETENAAMEEKARKDRIRETRLKNDMKNFDSLSAERQKEVGDELLKRFREDTPNTHFDSEARRRVEETEQWIVDRIRKKSGLAIATGEFKRGSHGEKVYTQLTSDWDKINNREEEIKKSMRVRDGNAKDYRKFREACRNDEVWKALQDNATKTEKALCSAVLRDIGLSDTPENRELIEWYVFLD